MWFGIGYLFLTIIAVPKIGIIATSISTGMLIDYFGWFGGVQVSFDLNRFIAIILMLIALRLIYIANMKTHAQVENPSIES